MKIEEAMIVRCVLNNPFSSEAKISCETTISRHTLKLYLNDLVSEDLIAEHLGEKERKYTLNYKKFDVIVEVLRRLTALEEHLSNFGLCLPVRQYQTKYCAYAHRQCIHACDDVFDSYPIKC